MSPPGHCHIVPPDRSIRSLPTTCTHEARRGRGSYTTRRRDTLSLPSSTFPLPRFALCLSFAFSPLPAAFHPSHTVRKDDFVFHPSRGTHGSEQASKLTATFLFVGDTEPGPSCSTPSPRNFQGTTTVPFARAKAIFSVQMSIEVRSALINWSENIIGMFRK